MHLLVGDPVDEWHTRDIGSRLVAVGADELERLPLEISHLIRYA